MSFLKNMFGGSKAKTESWTPPPPPSDEAVARAEAALSIKFPSSFGSFMREARAMQLPPGASYYWVGEESLGQDNIVEANRREHKEASSPLPGFLVVFYHDGMGNQVCFDTRRCSKDGEYPIVFWDHELSADENLSASDRASGHPELAGVIASSFPDWLRSRS